MKRTRRRLSKRTRNRILKRNKKRTLSRKRGGSFFGLFGESPEPKIQSNLNNLEPTDSRDIQDLRKEVDSLKSKITNVNDLKLVLDRVDNLKTLLNKIESVNTSIERVKSNICD